MKLSKSSSNSKRKNCLIHIKTDSKDPKILKVRYGLGFMAIAKKETTPFEFSCCKADCGICSFKVLEGKENLSSPSKEEKDFLEAMKSPNNERLACQARVFGDVSLYIKTDW